MSNDIDIICKWEYDCIAWLAQFLEHWTCNPMRFFTHSLLIESRGTGFDPHMNQCTIEEPVPL